MKTYDKVQYSGNVNGWGEPKAVLMKTKIDERHANELNSHFTSTGIKYEEGEDADLNANVTEDQFDHGETNLAVQDGKVIETENKPLVKAKESAKKKEAEKIVDSKPKAKKVAKGVDKVHDDLTTDVDKV